MRILFVAPRIPHPLRRGYQVRAYHQLRLLSQRHRITLVAFGRPETSSAIESLGRFCEEIITVPRRISAMITGLGGAAFSNRPLQAGLYESAEMRRVVARLIGEKRHDLVHVQLARMAGFFDATTPVPRIIDLVDALSLNLRRRSQYDRSPLKIAAAIEAGRLLRYEHEICRSWDQVTVVSPIDRAAIGNFPNFSVNPSGVDLEQFVYGAGERDPYEIVFSGNLSYFSNVDAISWFARAVFPQIRREEPNAKLIVVGSRPTRKVRALAKLDPQIVIESTVRAVPPYLQRCRLAVAPMRAGSGQLFKVIEAMACGAPLVATSLAANGIEAESDRHLLIADTPQALARQAVRLIREPLLASRIALEARRLIERRYSWDRSVSDLEAIYRFAVDGADLRRPQRAAAV